jgi:alpha-mannosidase
MRIAQVASAELFAGTPSRPLQIIRVLLEGAEGDAGQVSVRAEGPAVSTPEPVLASAPQPGEQRWAEVGVAVAAPAAPGSSRPVTAIAEWPGGRSEQRGEITVAETGWTMWMVSHFHYDPVWWATQGQFTESRIFLPDADGRLPDTRTAFELVRLHLEHARNDPDYKFVLAELDYLKPHFDAHPEDRADLLEFIRAGRIEIVGGSYNEPNTNLTSAESTIRNAVFGLGYQRGVLGASPSAAWMLDAFGHDPGYPHIMAAAGLAESAWARGPFHQWGPQRSVGSNEEMQFASEFEWLAPDGTSLLTGYMPNHYGAGWVTHRAASLEDAERAALEQFRQLAPVAATRNVLLPVGADHVVPSRWVTGIHRDWNARYTWPRFVTAVPSEFFAAVRKEAAERDVWITPQTRDMNPVYTGKDVSYIDTKQAQRAAEIAVEDAERLAALAWLAGAGYPQASLDRAWRLLVFGAHHDAITGTESDQVYLDLLAGWREAFDRAAAARGEAAAWLAGLADTTVPAGGAALAGARAVVVFNTLSWPRDGLASITLRFPEPGTQTLAVCGRDGAELPLLAEGVRRHEDGTVSEVTLRFWAREVPALGYRTYWAVPLPDGELRGWEPAGGNVIENEVFRIEADPAAGGTLRSVLDKRSGTELLAGPGNELVVQEEYPGHPRWGEGPWLLSPRGPGTGSARQPARLRAERCPAGSRLVAGFRLGDLEVTQETVLYDGAGWAEFATHIDGSIGQDRLLRVRFPADVPGGLPVYQTALAAIGRTPGRADVDVAQHAYTMDNPAHEWFAVSAAARLLLTGPGGERRPVGGSGGSPPRASIAIGVAELIPPGQLFRGASPPGPPFSRLTGLRGLVRDLMARLARAGVTATCSRPDGPRYGSAELDSNLPDVRIVLGGPEVNAFTGELLAADPDLAEAVRRELASGDPARVFVPAGRPRREAFAPGPGVAGIRDVPVLIVAGHDLDAAVAALIADLADGQAEAAPAAAPHPSDVLAGHSVALLNRGTPGSLAEPGGTLHISLMRACSAWPCGVWIDGERRAAPDGSSFAWQHWSHTFRYALAAGTGDWRDAGFARAGLEYNRDLICCETGLHDGPLPGRVSLAAAEPAGVLISAVKPRGNPLAPPAALPGAADGPAELTVRLRDLTGQGRAARLSLLGGIAGARLTDLTENDTGPDLPVRDGAVELNVPPAGTATVAVDARPLKAAVPRPASAATAQQPAEFTRYWLHGTGPAPAGNMPVSVHLSPGRVTLSDAGPAGKLRLTIACGPRPAAGEIQLLVPAGLRAAPAGPLRFELAPLGHAAWDLTVEAAAGAAAGRYFLAAQVAGADGAVFEDAALITVGEPGPPDLSLPLDDLLPRYLADQQAQQDELEMTVSPARAEVAPGAGAVVAVRIANRTRCAIRGRISLLSPFGSWEAVPHWHAAFTAGTAEPVTAEFPVRVPAAARPGQQSWALAKAAYFGRVRYSQPVSLTVSC